jgi:hypothetical protein
METKMGSQLFFIKHPLASIMAYIQETSNLPFFHFLFRVKRCLGDFIEAPGVNSLASSDVSC